METEKQRLVLWLPVWFAAGALAYLSLPFEPDPYASALPLAPAAWVAHHAWRRAYALWPVCVALLVGVLGFGWMLLYTALWPVTMLGEELSIRELSGHIVAIGDVPEGYRLTLSDVTIEGLRPADTPTRVRLKLRGEAGRGLLSGQRVRLRAGLLPPSGPVMPGAFDFARYFYFQGIGAVGYAIPPVERSDGAGEAEENGFALWLTRWREGLSRRIRAQMSAPEGAVAAALMTGDRAAIPEPVNEAMRDTNLSHILAISGMHMALVTGLLFFALRRGLVALPLTRHVRHPKKFAAALALLAGAAYLLVAGLPISACRAYIMVALVFGAILLDRQVMPMRSLALAALLLLLLNPSYAMQPGFQLSFAATAALIAWYEQVRLRAQRYEDDAPQARLKRAGVYLAGVLMTTLVAEAATAPLVWYHFNSISLYGLLANLLIMPVVTFWIMPFIIIAFVLLPFGLESLALVPVEWGIGAMLAVAQWVAGLPGSQFFHPAPPGWGMALIGLGLAWLLLWQSRLRRYGLVPVAVGVLSVLSVQPPDLLISANGKQIAGRIDGQLHMIKGRPGSFTPEQWAHGAGMEALPYVPRRSDAWRCDALGCVYRYAGRVIAFPASFEAQAEDCRRADLVVTPFYLSPEACGAPVLDRRVRARHGAYWLWLGDTALRMQSTRDVQGDRTWNR